MASLSPFKTARRREGPRASAPTPVETERLRTLVPLHTLSPSGFEALLDGLEVEEYAPNTRLLAPGDRDGTHLYLLEGRLALRMDRGPAEEIAAGSGEARFPIAHEQPRRHEVRTVGRVRCVRLESRRLSELLAAGPQPDYQVQELQEGAGDDDWMTLLLQSPVLQRIPAANIQRVMMRVEHLELAAGEVVIREGEEGDYYYIITGGQAAVTRERPGEGAEELARLGVGDAFGEEALLSDRPRGCTVTMLTAGALLRLAKKDFLELINHPLLHSCDREEAQALAAEGALWLDVREPEAFAAGHPEGACNLPLAVLRHRVSELDPERRYIVCSDAEGASTAAAFLLTERGFEVSVLRGGCTGAGPAPAMDAGEGAAAGPAQQAPPAGPSPQLETYREAYLKVKRRLLRSEQARSALAEELEAARAAAAGEERRLRERLAALEAQRSSLQERLQEASGREEGSGPVPSRVPDEALQQELEGLRRDREELDGLQRELGRSGRELAAAEAAREAARAEAERLAAAVHELRSVMEEYVDRLQNEPPGEDEVAEALRAELAMVRQQAEQDVGQLKAELALARAAAGPPANASEGPEAEDADPRTGRPWGRAGLLLGAAGGAGLVLGGLALMRLLSG